MARPGGRRWRTGPWSRGEVMGLFFPRRRGMRPRPPTTPDPCPSSPPPSTRPRRPSGPTGRPRGGGRRGRRAAGRRPGPGVASATWHRHRERGKLPARERIELLVDRDSAFLELAPLAAWGTEYTVGASLDRRHRRGRGRRVPDLGPRPHGPGRGHEPVLLPQGCPGLRHRPRRTGCRSINLVESGGADLPGPGRAVHPRGPGLPRPDPPLGGRPAHRGPGVRQLDRRGAPTCPA